MCMHGCMYMLGHNFKCITLYGLESLKPKLKDLKNVFSSLVFSLLIYTSAQPDNLIWFQT